MTTSIAQKNFPLRPGLLSFPLTLFTTWLVRCNATMGSRSVVTSDANHLTISSDETCHYHLNADLFVFDGVGMISCNNRTGRQYT